ncbi:hypothetical protein SAMN02745150_01376 [Brevinema andersonii]|uniref:Uncharacterized protein n=1 Tax=Brevinema andersonii TaxID=34097 RepID=A0A1I1F2C1_BREAD|nr:hypothetical protein [Brevinema andersonii]SFB93589.1 hypothetical protein SAMN02745150_01376 [Brevinema andersonii]
MQILLIFLLLLPVYNLAGDLTRSKYYRNDPKAIIYEAVELYKNPLEVSLYGIWKKNNTNYVQIREATNFPMFYEEVGVMDTLSLQGFNKKLEKTSAYKIYNNQFLFTFDIVNTKYEIKIYKFDMVNRDHIKLIPYIFNKTITNKNYIRDIDIDDIRAIYEGEININNYLQKRKRMLQDTKNAFDLIRLNTTLSQKGQRTR